MGFVIDYHAIQLTGSSCGGRNCAAASAAMAIYFGSNGRVRLTADQVRAQSGVSCIPNVRTPSGGLFISDVLRVAAARGVILDYGRDPLTGYKRWPSAEAKTRLTGSWGGIFLGDYDQVRAPYRATTTFAGDHSVFAHDYRASDATVCWHDPLRPAAIRVPLAVLLRYWQKPTSPIRGFAGFVRIQPAPKPAPSPATSWAPDIASDIKAAYKAATVAAKLRSLGIPAARTGTVLHYSDLVLGLRARGIGYGTSVQLIDVRALMRAGTS